MINRFFSISRSTRAIFIFQRLRSLLEIAQNVLIVHHFGQWGCCLVLMGVCLELDILVVAISKKLRSNPRKMPLMDRKITLHHHAKWALFHIISHKIWYKYLRKKCFDQTLGKDLRKWLLLAATTYRPWNLLNWLEKMVQPPCPANERDRKYLFFRNRFIS